MIHCVLHGSLRKQYDLMREVADLFSSNGITVVAPVLTERVGETEGFVHLAGDVSSDPRVQELRYLRHVAELGREGFSYYLNPDGRLGVSVSYELAIDLLLNVRTIFMEKLVDHPAYVPHNSVWRPEELVSYISEKGMYPPPVVVPDERPIREMLGELILPGSIVAVGGIIVDYSSKKYKTGQERDVLMVKTHKWGGRFSIVGGKVRRNERLAEGLVREIAEETGLEGEVKESICTFDEIQGSGYYLKGTHKVFTDTVVRVCSRKVVLNDEAEAYVWMPGSVALRDLDIEPNARKTLEVYVERFRRVV